MSYKDCGAFFVHDCVLCLGLLCKRGSSRLPVVITARLAGGHNSVTIGAPAADLIKVRQLHCIWHPQTHRPTQIDYT